MCMGACAYDSMPLLNGLTFLFLTDFLLHLTLNSHYQAWSYKKKKDKKIKAYRKSI